MVVLRALLAVTALLVAAPAAEARTVWLCKPGLAQNACDVRFDSARYTPDGQLLGGDDPRLRRRRVDCFYVYPTVSGQPTPAATRRIDPEIRSIVRWQAARYGRTCRVFAPVYRQVTLAGLGSAQPAHRRRAYRDVRAAWRDVPRPPQPRPGRDPDRPLAGHVRPHATCSRARSRTGRG